VVCVKKYKCSTKILSILHSTPVIEVGVICCHYTKSEKEDIIDYGVTFA